MATCDWAQVRFLPGTTGRTRGKPPLAGNFRLWFGFSALVPAFFKLAHATHEFQRFGQQKTLALVGRGPEAFGPAPEVIGMVGPRIMPPDPCRSQGVIKTAPAALPKGQDFGRPCQPAPIIHPAEEDRRESR